MTQYNTMEYNPYETTGRDATRHNTIQYVITQQSLLPSNADAPVVPILESVVGGVPGEDLACARVRVMMEDLHEHRQ